MYTPSQPLRPDEVEALPISLNFNDFGLAGLGNLMSIDEVQVLDSSTVMEYDIFSLYTS